MLSGQRRPELSLSRPDRRPDTRDLEPNSHEMASVVGLRTCRVLASEVSGFGIWEDSLKPCDNTKASCPPHATCEALLYNGRIDIGMAISRVLMQSQF